MFELAPTFKENLSPDRVRGKLSAGVTAFVARQRETCEDALYLPDVRHCDSDLFLMINETNARDTYSSEKTSSKLYNNLYKQYVHLSSD